MKVRIHNLQVIMKMVCLSSLYCLVSTNSYASSFLTYQNARFNYAIDYPTILHPQGEPENGDGQVISNDSAKLIVWGSYLPESLNESFNYAKSDLKNFKITYSHKTKTQFILSGENNSQIAYFKSIFICGENINFQLYYPKKDKAKWNDIVNHISHSLKYADDTCRQN